MKIFIEEYNPDWKVKFQKEKELLVAALSGVKCQIEHIGSTSVEGLGAKPIIDILIGLDEFSIANEQINKLIAIGYQYIDKYEDIMPDRRFLIKENNGVRIHHIHMVEINSEFWQRHLAFRDYLVNNPTDMIDYHNLKRKLSVQDWKDMNEYAAAKSAFIKDIEKKALSGQC